MPQKDLQASALLAVENMCSAADDQLFAHLGNLLQLNRLDPKTVADFTPAESHYEMLGFSKDLKTLGRKYFDEVNRQAYELVCDPGAEDSAERRKLIAAFGMERSEVTAALAVLLATQLAIAPAIATVVAVLTIRLFFNPAYHTMCDLWKERLQSPRWTSASTG